MPKYDTVPCEHCDEMVNMHPMSLKKHKRECKAMPVETEQEVKVVEKTKVDEPKINDPKAKERYEMAMKAQETRKKAPELYVAGVHSDERKELIKRYAPKCVDPPFNPLKDRVRKYAEWHAFWSDPDKADMTAHRAYIPVFNEHGDQVTHKGDLLFMIQREMWMSSKIAASEESKARRKSDTDGELEDLKATAGEGITVTSSRHEEKIE